MSRVDRRKHDWDVMEHVFGGVQADSSDVRGRVVNEELRPWVGGDATTVVEVTVNTMPEQQQSPEPPRPNRHQDENRHREYESDRRGEHKYPHEDDRPSQRERDDLKERLERGR